MNDTLENNDKTVTPDDVNAALLNNGDDGNKYCCPSYSIQRWLQIPSDTEVDNI